MQLIVVFLVLIIFLLAALCSFLLFYYFKINKVINIFLEKGKVKDVKDLLFEHLEHAKKIGGELGKAEERIKTLENISKISLQRIGVVRFNPFGDMGGDQSFAIALLDSNNDGFIISSLFTQEGNRVYAKAVIKGESKHILSAEEKEAILRAIKNHD